MTGYVLRRSALSLSLLAVLLAAGGGVLVWLGVPVWVPAVIAVVVVAGQYALAPYLIQWLIPATRIAWVGDHYDTHHQVGAIVARRCAEAGLSRSGWASWRTAHRTPSPSGTPAATPAST